MSYDKILIDDNGKPIKENGAYKQGWYIKCNICFHEEGWKSSSQEITSWCQEIGWKRFTRSNLWQMIDFWVCAECQSLDNLTKSIFQLKEEIFDLRKKESITNGYIYNMTKQRDDAINRIDQLLQRIQRLENPPRRHLPVLPYLR